MATTRYAHDETAGLRATGRKVPEGDESPSRPPWRRLVATVGLAATAGAALGAVAYVELGQSRPTPHAMTTLLETATEPALSFIPFARLDTNGDGSLEEREIATFVGRKFDLAIEEVNNDPTLSDADRAHQAGKIENTRADKINCWIATLHKFHHSAPTRPLSADEYPYYMNAVVMACTDPPQGATTDPSLALTDAELMTVNTNNEDNKAGEKLSQGTLIDPSLSFADVDTNMDEILDAQELMDHLNAFYKRLLDGLKADASLDPDVRALKLEVVQEQYQRQRMCLERAIAKLEKDHVVITPSSYAILETVFTELCPSISGDSTAAAAPNAPSGDASDPVAPPSEDALIADLVRGTNDSETNPPLVPIIDDEVPGFQNQVEEDAAITFADLDTNHDEVLDPSELTTHLDRFYQGMLTEVDADTGLEPADRAFKRQLIEEQYAHQAKCLRLALAKLTAEHTVVTPGTYAILEEVINQVCPMSGDDVDPATPATASGSDPLEDAINSELVHEVEGGGAAPTDAPTASPEASSSLPPLALPGLAVDDAPPTAATTQPPTTSNADVVDGPDELKAMLMKAFGLTPSAMGSSASDNTEPLPPLPTPPSLDDAEIMSITEPPVLTDSPTSPPLPPPLPTTATTGTEAGGGGDGQEDPVDAGLKELIESEFLKILDPGLSPPSGWNWLDPAMASYDLVKSPDADRVEVSSVYHHLLEEHQRRTEAAIAAMLRDQITYNLTLTCFNAGIERLEKMEISRAQYADLVHWMNDKCHGDSDDQGLTDDDRLDHAMLPREAFRARLLGPFAATLDRQQLNDDNDDAVTLRSQVEACVDQATHDAIDQATGLVDVARYNPAIVWILDQCLATGQH